MKREITHTTKGNSLGELQAVINSLVERVGPAANIVDIEADVEREWMQDPDGTVTHEWHKGRIGVRVEEP